MRLPLRKSVKPRALAQGKSVLCIHDFESIIRKNQGPVPLPSEDVHAQSLEEPGYSPPIEGGCLETEEKAKAPDNEREPFHALETLFVWLKEHYSMCF